MTRQLASEVIGTALLLMAAVGSGAMGTALAGGNAGLALLASALVTGGTLYVIITTLGPVSGAHFNPAVTLYFLLRGEFAAGLALAYVAAQCLGGFIGVWTVHLMFAEPVIQVSQTMHRTGGAQWFSELVATLGLLFTIAGGLKSRPEQVPALVGIYIAAAYWFTSSTSLANPAATLARGFTDMAAGIYPGHVPMFVLSQLAAALVGAWVWPRLFR
jgi:glycerol uptake facilitator-like aquaporin